MPVSVPSRRGRAAIDILINNAALFDLAPIVEISRASYDRLFSINVAGTLFMLQAVAKAMIARGERRRDHQHGHPGGPARRGPGGGLLRHQGGGHQPHPVGRAQPHQHGINVNAIAPGVVDGEHWDGVTRCSRNTRTARSARRSGWSARPFPMAAWAGRRT